MKATLYALLLALPPFCAEATAPRKGADLEIKNLIESFRSAIIDKDKARFMAVFVPGHVTWQAVTSDPTLRRNREQNPHAVKVAIDPAKNHVVFIDRIVSDPEPIEEKLYDIRIDSGEDVASVIFRYSYHRSTRQTNQGQEMWLLVRTDHGWRIASVVWSIHAPSPSAEEARATAGLMCAGEPRPEDAQCS